MKRRTFLQALGAVGVGLSLRPASREALPAPVKDKFLGAPGSLCSVGDGAAYTERTAIGFDGEVTAPKYLSVTDADGRVFKLPYFPA